MPASEVEQALDWMQASPENIDELHELQQLDRWLKRVNWSVNRSARARLAAKATSPNSNVVPFPTTASRPGTTDEAQKAHDGTVKANDEAQKAPDEKPRADDPCRKRSEPRWLLTAIAATLVMALFVTLSLTGHAPGSAIKTGLIQGRSIKLSDGMRVDLDARSELKLDCHDNRRVIYLRSGRATFQVPKGLSTPCVVKTDAFDLRAEAGTLFTVQVDNLRVHALVHTGLVTATPPGQPSSADGVTLRPGEFAQMDSDGQLSITGPASK